MSNFRLFAAAAVMLAALCCGLTTAAAHAQDAAERPLGQAAPPERIDPTVQHVLDLNPTTPEERIRAALVLVDLGAPHHALPWLEALVAEGLSDEQLGQLRAKLGMHSFLRLARVDALEPAAGQLAQAVAAAAERVSRDPARIGRYLEQLGEAAPEKRRAAAVQLQMAGSAAVQPLLDALRQADEGPRREALRQALVGLERDAVPALVAALEAPDAAIQTAALESLSRLGARHTSPYWLRSALVGQGSPQQAAAEALLAQYGQLPSLAEAAARLVGAAEQERYTATTVDPTEAAAEIEHWSWDQQANRLRQDRLPASLVRALRVERLAGDAYAILPSHPQARRLYLGARLEAAARRRGLDETADDQPLLGDLARDPAALNDLLRHSLESGLDVAAQQAAWQLGRVGSFDWLRGEHGRPAPLVQALRHPSPRVRFAALEAIVRLRPEQAFPGSSWVTESLAHFANSMGQRRAVVADPRTTEAQRLGGMLIEMGYDVELANDGSSFFHLAAEHPDTELVVLTPALDRPTLAETLGLLRRDSRTARLPIAVMVTLPQYDAAVRLIHGDDYAQVLVRPHETLAFQGELAPLLARDVDGLTPAAVRLAQAKQATGWLAELSQTPGWLFDLHHATAAAQRTLNHPDLTPASAKFLGHLGTHAAQRALADLTSHGSREISQRQAAAAALRNSLARRGVQLTTGEILEQYARYNRSEIESPEAQAALGSILDAMETRAQPPFNNPAVERPWTD